MCANILLYEYNATTDCYGVVNAPLSLPTGAQQEVMERRIKKKVRMQYPGGS